MEDADGILFISKGYLPTIGHKRKAIDKYEGWIMGGSWHKGTRNDKTEPVNVGDFQYFEIKDNKGADGCIG